jgi:hypothetical protein
VTSCLVRVVIGFRNKASWERVKHGAKLSARHGGIREFYVNWFLSNDWNLGLGLRPRRDSLFSSALSGLVRCGW